MSEPITVSITLSPPPPPTEPVVWVEGTGASRSVVPSREQWAAPRGGPQSCGQHPMSGNNESVGRIDAIERAICQERCAYMGEPACWKVAPNDWPNQGCEDPGCNSLAYAVEIALRVREMADG